jgi:ribosomal protein S18 acetylase RimI-like enzyme
VVARVERGQSGGERVSCEIFLATSPDDHGAFGELIARYVDWCRVRYRHDAWFVDQALSHQSLADELTQLEKVYGPPNGRAFLARADGAVCGCGAYYRLTDTVCEMKRLFVSDGFQGKGIGRSLAETLIGSAIAEGFTLMRLDTANRLTEAIAMYESLGFRRCAPYKHYPERLMPYLVFMERPLAAD